MSTEATTTPTPAAPPDGVGIVATAVLADPQIVGAVDTATKSAAIVTDLKSEVADIARASAETTVGVKTLIEEQARAKAELTKMIDQKDAASSESSVTANTHLVAMKSLIESVESLGSMIHERMGEKIDANAGTDNDWRAAMEATIKDLQGVRFTPGTGADPRRDLAKSPEIKTFRAELANGARNVGLINANDQYTASCKPGQDLASISYKSLFGRDPGTNVGAFGGVTKAVEGLTTSEFYNQPHVDTTIITAPGWKLRLSDLIPHEMAAGSTTWAGHRNLIFSATGVPTVPGEQEIPGVFGNATYTLEGDTFAKAVALYEEINGPIVYVGHQIDQINNLALANHPDLESNIIEQMLEGIHQGNTTEYLSGVAPGITGILNSPEVPTWLASTDGAAYSTHLHQLRAAYGAQEENNFTPTVALTSTKEFTHLELIENGFGDFLWGNIGEGPQRTAWRMAVMSGPWVPQDTINEQVLIMDPSESLVIYDTSDPIQVRTMQEDHLNFDRNSRSIQAFMRSGLNIKNSRRHPPYHPRRIRRK